MSRRVTQEQLLSDEALRKQIIKEDIYGDENRERKAQMLRRHEILKGKSKKWVMFGIEREGYRPETVEQMRNRASNIPVARKINGKLSQTYSGGVTRTLGEPIKQKVKEKGEDGTEKEVVKITPNPEQVSMDQLYDILNFNTTMKKVDRFRNGFYNCLGGIVPVQNNDETTDPSKPKLDLQFQVLAPWKYDIIEDPNDPTKILAVIISQFTERICFKTYNDAAGANGVRTSVSLAESLSDGKDALIADRPEDKEQASKDRRFIWWTSKYHFTTDIYGEIIPNESPADLRNYIGKLPWINFAKDQDGSFWAEGADDIFETDILTNKKMTDCNFIQFIQGWGQLVVDAEGEMPKKLIGGPDNAWIFQRTPGAAPAQIYYATSNPPIEKWLDSIRMQLGLCLSTNNLSVRNLSAKLEAENAASGIVLMVENSELVPDVEDSQAYFQDKEPELLDIAASWLNPGMKNKWLTKAYEEITTPIKTTKVMTKFHQVKVPISEKEELEIMKMEKDLGIVTLIDLLRKRNPDLTEEQAREKAEQIWEEKKKMSAMVTEVAKDGQQGGIAEAGDGGKPEPEKEAGSEDEDYE